MEPAPLLVDRLISLAPTIAVVGAGIWAFYIYRRTRKGQASVGIETTARLHQLQDGTNVLILSLKISNPSSVLFTYREATVTLFDAEKTTPKGSLRLAPFAQADPFVPVYGELNEDPDLVASGQTFSTLDANDISLEPQESLATELAFPLHRGKLGLMAVRVDIRGTQGSLGKKPFNWASFRFIDPSSQPMSTRDRIRIRRGKKNET